MSYFNQKKYTIAFILTLIVLNFITLGTLWWGHSSNKGHHHPPHKQHFLEQELRLSDTQKQQFYEFRQAHFKRMSAADETIHQHKKVIFQELTSENPQNSKADSVTQLIGQLEAKRQQYIFEHFYELKSACSPEQQQKFGRIFKNVIEQPHKKMGNHPSRH